MNATLLARPTVLTPGAMSIILAHLAAGSFLSMACGAAGVRYQTFRSWQRRWEDDDPAAMRFHEFFAAVALASATVECRVLEAVRSGTPDWLASACFLNRRFPQRWGRRHRLVEVPAPGKPLSAMTDAALDGFERAAG